MNYGHLCYKQLQNKINCIGWKSYSLPFCFKKNLIKYLSKTNKHPTAANQMQIFPSKFVG